MISKELLSEVAGHDKFIREFIIKGNTIKINPMYAFNDDKLVKYGYESTINIYELAHKCKEWAFHRGYRIIEDEFYIRISKLSSGEYKSYEYDENEENAQDVYKPEYTFKACQWALEKEGAPNEH